MGDHQIYFTLPKDTSIRLLKIAPGNHLDGIEGELVLADSLSNPMV